MSQGTVLVVDDDAPMRGLIAQAIEEAGLACVQAGDGVEALRKAKENPPDAVVLDVRLPRKGGVEVCRELRQMLGKLPIIGITAFAREEVKQDFLEMGALDFLNKPFNPRDLALRLRNLIAGMQPAAPKDDSILRFEGIEIDPENHCLQVDDMPVQLTPTEWAILCVLVKNHGRIVIAQMILEDVWKIQEGYQTEYLHTFVSTLRKKLHDTAKPPRFIETVYATGYRFIALPRGQDGKNL